MPLPLNMTHDRNCYYCLFLLADTSSIKRNAPDINSDYGLCYPQNLTIYVKTDNATIFHVATVFTELPTDRTTATTRANSASVIAVPEGKHNPS